ncbi:hypothetical protein GA0070606_0630 [Micromonospora citrea]|uniref:Uncharacterized protein n=1 Tax=Micromonospora citrea TaxID=47855 RepID=A0A1C6TU06_9ACTN|nr:hypothetical protein [Micromonospora citrea]SCL45159.1 hypothetical protein GA0070606_0630 [Micromonospora citrea]
MTVNKLLRTALHAPPANSDTERPVPRWVLRLAYAMPLLLLPSCLWRLPFAFHFEMGQLHEGGMPGLWLSIPYVFGLSVLSELIAFLCIGLVRRWGEVAPAWIPFIGGRPIRPLAAVVPAVLGGLALTVLFGSVPVGDGQTLTVFGVGEDTPYVNGWWKALAMVCTAPIRVWGPVVLVLAVAYHLRRRAVRTDPTPAPAHG